MAQKRHNSYNHGYTIKFKNKAQQQASHVFNNNALAFILGPAGTGKTFLATAFAVKEAYENRYNNIILTRPIVEAQEEIGTLRGNLKEKTDPHMGPLYEQYRKATHSCKEQMCGKMSMQPIAYSRGHTFENAVCILDEAQNCTYGQLKLYLTRLGQNSKYVVTGDLTQVDISNSGLAQVVEKLRNITNVGVHEFTAADCVRHRLVRDISEVL